MSDDYTYIDELEQANHELASRIQVLENQLASGIHTCHDYCQHPMCVARRRIRELENTARLVMTELDMQAQYGCDVTHTSARACVRELEKVLPPEGE